MNAFKVFLEYDGSRYSGWQEQKNARTVMGELRKAADSVFHGDVDMQGAGRTDAPLRKSLKMPVGLPVPISCRGNVL